MQILLYNNLKKLKRISPKNNFGECLSFDIEKEVETPMNLLKSSANCPLLGNVPLDTY